MALPNTMRAVEITANPAQLTCCKPPRAPVRAQAMGRW